MPDVWCPGIIIDPGVAATYTLGRNRMEVVKLHYTAGAYGSDYPIGKAGYFQLYVPRDYQAVQFAEVNALCWDSGNFNDKGPGIEFEKLNDSMTLTETQLHWGRRIFAWLAEWGFSPTLYDTGGDNSLRVKTVPPGYDYINHRALDQRPDNHVDYISPDEFQAMTASQQEKEMAITVYSVRRADGSDTGRALRSTGGPAVPVDDQHKLVPGRDGVVVDGWDYYQLITEDDEDRMLQRGKYAPGGAGGATTLAVTLTGEATPA